MERCLGDCIPNIPASQLARSIPAGWDRRGAKAASVPSTFAPLALPSPQTSAAMICSVQKRCICTSHRQCALLHWPRWQGAMGEDDSPSRAYPRYICATRHPSVSRNGASSRLPKLERFPVQASAHQLASPSSQSVPALSDKSEQRSRRKGLP